MRFAIDNQKETADNFQYNQNSETANNFGSFRISILGSETPKKMRFAVDNTNFPYLDYRP